MADPVPSQTAKSPALSWGLIAVGLLLSAAAIWYAPGWVGGLGIASEWTLIITLYAAIFLPMVIVALVFARIDGFSAFLPGRKPGQWALAGLACGVLGMAAATGYAAIAGSLIGGSFASPAISGLAVGALIILFQTGSEELLFRGWLQAALQRQIGIAGAIALSAALFSGFHILGGARSPMAIGNLLLGGIWFGLLAWRSGGLLAPICAHFGWNASEELIAGLTPNPGAGSFGALFDWDLAGVPIWGGSEEGLNSSIGMAVVLIALIIPLVWRRAIVPAVPAQHPRGHAAG